MDINLQAIPQQSWFDLCALAVKYATEEKEARKEQRNRKGGETDTESADHAAPIT